jgi:trans-aconitate 2-methyltransferase
VQADIGADLSSLGAFDLVFANASLQWVPDHRNLLPRLFGLLNRGGALAAQIPRFLDMPIAQAIRDTANSPQYAAFFTGFEPGLHHCADEVYYDTLSRQSRALDLWATHYYHVLENHLAILDWIESTGMRPFLAQLPEDRREAFKAQVLGRVRNLYPAQSDGRPIFIFKRFFFVAYKA